MAKNRSNDFVDFLRSQGLRKRVAKALSDLEGSGRGARGNAERIGKRVIADLRSAADEIEKRLNLGGAGTRSRAAKKAAKTRKRTTAKRRPATKKAAKKTTARKTSARKTSARKTTARKSTARKSTGRKTTARKSSARKRS
jgi:hypothetical protein